MPSKILNLKGCFIKRHCSPLITICSLYTSPWQDSTLALGYFFPPAALLCRHPALQAGAIPCRQASSEVGSAWLARTSHSHHTPVITDSTALPFLVPCKNPAICTFFSRSIIQSLKTQCASSSYMAKMSVVCF